MFLCPFHGWSSGEDNQKSLVVFTQSNIGENGHLDADGLLTIVFIANHDYLYINEIATTPHNDHL